MRSVCVVGCVVGVHTNNISGIESDTKKEEIADIFFYGHKK